LDANTKLEKEEEEETERGKEREGIYVQLERETSWCCWLYKANGKSPTESLNMESLQDGGQQSGTAECEQPLRGLSQAT
jgi:hypothetical protein